MKGVRHMGQAILIVLNGIMIFGIVVLIIAGVILGTWMQVKDSEKEERACRR